MLLEPTLIIAGDILHGTGKPKLVVSSNVLYIHLLYPSFTVFSKNSHRYGAAGDRTCHCLVVIEYEHLIWAHASLSDPGRACRAKAMQQAGLCTSHCLGVCQGGSSFRVQGRIHKS
jgi:hypothetical protein